MSFIYKFNTSNRTKTFTATVAKIAKLFYISASVIFTFLDCNRTLTTSHYMMTVTMSIIVETTFFL